MRDDVHLQSDRAVGHDRSHASQADDAQRFVAVLVAQKFAFFPTARFHGRGGLGDLARERHHHGDGVLGGGDGIAAGVCSSHDPALAGGGNVDVVHPRAGAADGGKLSGRFDDLGVTFVAERTIRAS
jgi:hypothetical protein